MGDWFNTVVEATKAILIEKEKTSQAEVLNAVPINEQIGATPVILSAGIATSTAQAFSIPTEAYYVLGAAVVALVVYRVA